MSGLQVGMIVFFLTLAILGLLLFAGIIPGFGGSTSSRAGATKVLVWGTLPFEVVERVSDAFVKRERGRFDLTYVVQSSEDLEINLLRAIADGTAPDILFFPDDLLLSLESQFFMIPPESMNERAFRERFAEAGELFNVSGGILALPVVLDPVVMYWNRDIFKEEGVLKPPEFWDELFNLGKSISVKDTSGKVLKSAVALGETQNITHSKEILSTLFMQTGTSITSRTSTGRVVSELTRRDESSPITPAESGLIFYTDFSNPVKPHYSWNASLPRSRDAFGAEKLAIYFGLASDLEILRRGNPHLNFDVASVPQLRNGRSKLTWTRTFGGAVLKNSKQIGPALEVLYALTDAESGKMFSELLHLPPARRDLLSLPHPDPYLASFYRSAAFGKGWLDPDDSETTAIFKDMVDKVTARRITPSVAVFDAGRQLDGVLQSLRVP